MAREPQDHVPEAPRGRRLPARDSVLVVVGALFILILLAGGSVRSAGEEMDPGFQRDVVMAVGEPTGWLADRLPLESAAGDALAWLSPDDDLEGGGGFAEAATPATGGGRAAAGGPVSPSEFDPVELGAKAERPRELKTVLVTGDSLAQPLDAEMARRLAGDDVKTVRDVHVGTGISKTDLLDWGKLSATQASKDKPDAVVVFIGANEGFPMPGSPRTQGPVLRPGVGGGLRHARAADDAGLPPGRQDARVLADAALPARQVAPGDRPRGERGHRGRGRAVPGPGQAAGHGPGLHARRALPGRDRDRGAQARGA